MERERVAKQRELRERELTSLQEEEEALGQALANNNLPPRPQTGGKGYNALPPADQAAAIPVAMAIPAAVPAPPTAMTAAARGGGAAEGYF